MASPAKAKAPVAKDPPARGIPKIGDEVYVFDRTTYKVVPCKVASNPGDHIWIEGALGKGQHFVGPHSWDKTAKGAKDKAIVQLDEELSQHFARIETLQKIKISMQKKKAA
jgi:hypothetical protein